VVIPYVGKEGSHHSLLGLPHRRVQPLGFAIALCYCWGRADGTVGIHDFGFVSFSVEISVSVETVNRLAR
jgi:hypothetical protein